MFVCPECSAVNSADEWNEASREYYGDNMEERIGGNKDFYYFICPGCKGKMKGGNIGELKFPEKRRWKNYV